MLESAHRRWLLTRLPEWASEGILTRDAEERLRERYEADDDQAGSRIVVALFGVLGAALVGGGVILLLAHNWEELSRGVRAGLSLTPLLLCLALAARVLAGERGPAWREGTATAWTLSIGAAISLVSQTYHIPGDWTSFLRTWLLLGLAIPYLLRSVTAALLYLLGLVSWVLSCAWGAGDPVLFWPLLALAVPFLVGRLRTAPETAGSELLAWAAALTVAIGSVPSVEHLSELLWSPFLASTCLALWGISKLARPRRWERPFRVVGSVGFLGTALVSSYASTWNGQARASIPGSAATAWEGVGVALVAAAAAGLLFLGWRRSGPRMLPLVAGLPVIWLALLVAERWSGDEAAVLVNLYLLGAGIAFLLQGLRTESLSRANLGTALVGLLVLLRFFDTDWGFLIRGAAFIVVGLAFLLVNVALLRRREAS